VEITTSESKKLDPTAWLNSHGDYLYHYALVRVRDTATAEDLLQETLLAAIRAAETHEGRSSERTWLTGIMKHKVFDYFRRLARRPESQMAKSEDRNDLDCFETTGVWRGHWREERAPMSWPIDAARLLESREFCETFDRCLLGLPAQMAIAFSLREIDGMSTEEICGILDISPNHLWVILHRARAKLRQLLEVEWFRDDRSAAPPVKKETANRQSVAALGSEFSYGAVAA
jgi:RNA polymerase sigma-70 factor, ECF subfamily